MAAPEILELSKFLVTSIFSFIAGVWTSCWRYRRIRKSQIKSRQFGGLGDFRSALSKLLDGLVNSTGSLQEDAAHLFSIMNGYQEELHSSFDTKGLAKLKQFRGSLRDVVIGRGRYEPDVSTSPFRKILIANTRIIITQLDPLIAKHHLEMMGKPRKWATRHR